MLLMLLVLLVLLFTHQTGSVGRGDLAGKTYRTISKVALAPVRQFQRLQRSSALQFNVPLARNIAQNFRLDSQVRRGLWYQPKFRGQKLIRSLFPDWRPSPDEVMMLGSLWAPRPEVTVDTVQDTPRLEVPWSATVDLAGPSDLSDLAVTSPHHESVHDDEMWMNLLNDNLELDEESVGMTVAAPLFVHHQDEMWVNLLDDSHDLELDDESVGMADTPSLQGELDDESVGTMLPLLTVRPPSLGAPAGPTVAPPVPERAHQPAQVPAAPTVAPPAPERAHHPAGPAARPRQPDYERRPVRNGVLPPDVVHRMSKLPTYRTADPAAFKAYVVARVRLLSTMCGVLASRSAMEGRFNRHATRQSAYDVLSQHIMQHNGKPALLAFGSAFKGAKRRRGQKHGVPIASLRRAFAAKGVVVDGNEFWSSQVCSACGSFVTHPTHQKAECGFCGARTPRDETAAQNILLTTLFEMFFKMRVPFMVPELSHAKFHHFLTG